MLRKLAALLAGAILLVLGFMFSLMALAVIAVLGLAAWAYLWWKTREIRRTLRERAPDPQGQVIEGEAVVIEEYGARPGNALPGEPPRQ